LKEILKQIVINAGAAILVAVVLALPVTAAVDYIANRFGAVPVGTILAWIGTGDPPAGWEICNGKNGTPNLDDLFLRGVTDVTRAGVTESEEIRAVENDLAAGTNHIPAPADKYIGAALNRPKSYSVRFIMHVR
jgi:hypothetical protein